METGRHRSMTANEHIRIGSNSYEEVKAFKYLALIDKSKLCLGGNKM